MYINFSALKKYPDLTSQDFFNLAAIKNKETEYIVSHVDVLDYERYEALSLIKYIKATKKGQTPSELLRLDKRGEKILKDITTNGVISEEVEVLVEWLKTKYKGRSNGIIKNVTETRRRVQWYSDITGVKRNRLAVLLACFVDDAYNSDLGLSFEEFSKHNPRAHFSNLMDNIAWCPPNNFAMHYKLEESPLERYREANEEYIEKIWEKQGLNDE